LIGVGKGGNVMRFQYLTVATFTAILLSGCSDDPVYKTNPLEGVDLSKLQSEAQSATASKTQNTPSITSNIGKPQSIAIKRQETVVPPIKGLTDAEREEWNALNDEKRKASLEYSKLLQKWMKSDRATRGARPPRPANTHLMEKKLRLAELNLKIQRAGIPDKYKSVDRNVLSESEVDELISLEVKQAELGIKYQKELQEAQKRNPVQTQTNLSALYLQTYSNDPSVQKMNKRIAELQGKIKQAKYAESQKARMKSQSETYNVSFAESDIDQIIALESEKKQIRAEYNHANRLWSAQNKSTYSQSGAQSFNGANYAARPVLDQTRINEIDRRIREMRAPLDTAVQAEQTRNYMRKQSEKYNVSLLPSEIEELIELNAEKKRLRTEFQSRGSGSRNASSVDYKAYSADIREIDARVKEINAPIAKAQQAEREAKNPALRERRLEKERRQQELRDRTNK